MFKKNYCIPVLAILLFLSCKTNVYVADADISYTQIDYHNSKEDEELASLINPYKAEMEKEMGEVVCVMPESVNKSRPSSGLGNWFCDALLFQANQLNPLGADFAIQNYGGLRLPGLAKGDITKGIIFELMPFDNMLVILELDGETTVKLLDKIAESGGWPVSKGLSFKIKDKQAADIKIGGQPIDLDKTYRVAMPDYIANGGDNCDFLIPIPQDNSGVFIRQIILDYLKHKKELGEEMQIDKTKRIYYD